MTLDAAHDVALLDKLGRRVALASAEKLDALWRAAHDKALFYAIVRGARALFLAWSLCAVEMYGPTCRDIERAGSLKG